MWRNPKLGVTVAIVLAGSMWFYVQQVLIGHQRAEAALHGTPRGNLSDLYPRWLGARELLLHHRDPYSPEVTREIQTGYYGRPLDPTRPQDPKDQQGFAYPAYVVFLLAPTIGLPFADVQAWFRWFLVALSVVMVMLWLRALRWRPSSSITASLIVLAVGSFQVLQGIKLQQLSLLVAGLVAACAVALLDNYFALAGILLALATVKPQLVLPLAMWLLLWAVSDWRRRQNVIWGFVSTLTILFVAAEHVLPGWISRFREAATAYWQYTDADSVLDELLTPEWGRALALLIVLALVIMGWKSRRAPADSPAFILMIALVLAVTVVIVPKAAPYNQVLLLPGILLVVRAWRILSRKSRMTRSVLVVSSLVVLWPWLAATALTVASLFLPAQTVQRGWAAPLWTSLAIPLSVALLLACGFREFAKVRFVHQPGSAGVRSKSTA
jgi:glycosyl transferase family 87